jgi:hypothetical protein
MATTKQLFNDVDAFLNKRCGGKGKEKENSRRRKVDMSGQFPTLKVHDPEFILARLRSGESAGFFSKNRLIAKIGETQILLNNSGIPMAFGAVRQGGPVSTADIEKFEHSVSDGVDPATRADFYEVDSFYYIPLELTSEFPEPVILKSRNATIDLAVDIKKAMVDPRSFAENPTIIEISSTPDDELLLIRGGLVDLVSGGLDNQELLAKAQYAHTLIVDELRLRGIMPTEKAVWSRAFINDLPDSSFLFIEGGGKKDGEGKTVPRSLRHFPVKDGNGNIDLPHLRNAIARIPQSNAPGLNADKKKSLQDRARRMLTEAQKGDVTKFDVRDRVVRICKGATSTDVSAQEEHFIFGVVLVPNETDSQGDIYSPDEVRKAAHAYMEASAGTFKLMHAGQPVDGLKVLETYVTKVVETHNGETFPVGTWLMAARVLDNNLWENIKKGVFTGFSIGGSAVRENLQ